MLVIIVLSLSIINTQSQQVSQYAENNFLENNQVNQDAHLVFADEKEDKHTVFQYHKWSNFLIWGVLADVGILSSRYGVFSKYRLDIHAIIMGLCVIPTIVADVLMILIWNPPKFYGKEQLAYWHRPIGFTYLGLMVLQSLGGLILKLSTQSKRTQRTLKVQSLFHVYLGYMMYILGKIECGIGFYEVYTNAVDEGKWNVIGFWITYALIFFWRALFEILYYNGQLFNFLLRGKEIKCQPKTLQDALFVQQIISNNVDYQDTKMWFLFNNNIVDLTGFVHPGGQYIWEQTRGREISRFIYGGQGLEDGSAKAYRHSEQAIKLMNLHTIGRLEDPIKIGTWKLNTKTKLCDDVCYFGFVNGDCIPNVAQFGKYYQIKALNNLLVPIRQYTSVISMAPENVKYRRELVNYIEGVQRSLPQQPKYISEFPLIIKRYDAAGFSQYIHNSVNQDFEIQGPFGQVLPTKGRIALICGGTGVLPFLDLLDFQLKSLINYRGQEDKYIYFHITLVLAVRNKSELIGSDIYLPLISLSKSFKLVLKIKEYTDEHDYVDERFDGKFFQKHLGLLSRYDQFFICGPPSMNKSIPVVLQRLGVQKQQIHLV